MKKDFLKVTEEEAKTIIEYPNLRLTEGEIFRCAATWCMENSFKEPRKTFQERFQSAINFTGISSEDFIENVLPFSDILSRFDLKTITKQSFENKSDQPLTRFTLQDFYRNWMLLVCGAGYGSS